MAFESLTNAVTYKKATSLANGESFTAYYLGTQVSEQGYPNFVMDTLEGTRIMFSPAGNLKYLEKNGTPPIPGLLTRITKEGERKNKKAQTVGVYKFEQDREQKTTRYTDEQLKAFTTQTIAGSVTELRARIG